MSICPLVILYQYKRSVNASKFGKRQTYFTHCHTKYILKNCAILFMTAKVYPNKLTTSLYLYYTLTGGTSTLGLVLFAPVI